MATYEFQWSKCDWTWRLLWTAWFSGGYWDNWKKRILTILLRISSISLRVLPARCCIAAKLSVTDLCDRLKTLVEVWKHGQFHPCKQSSLVAEIHLIPKPSQMTRRTVWIKVMVKPFHNQAGYKARKRHSLSDVIMRKSRNNLPFFWNSWSCWQFSAHKF